MRISIVATMLVALAGCGSDAASPAGVAPTAPRLTESCDDRLPAVVELLRAGLPTYDYDPAGSLAELAETHDLVVAGTFTSFVRVDERVDEFDAGSSWTHVEADRPEVLHGDVDGPPTSFDIDSLWADGLGDDPLGDPVDGGDTRFVAFLHERPDAPSGYVVGVQGLAVACDTDDPPIAVIEPLPAGPRTLADLVDAVRGLERPSSDPAACTDPDQDVVTEPDWRRHADYRPWTRDGCPVRIDVLADRPGPAHCGWETVRVIITGDPLGDRYDGPENDVEYVRDPDDVMGLRAGLELDATLPATAVDTGFRSADEALWLDPVDGGWSYLVSETHVERWPRVDSLLCD